MPRKPSFLKRQVALLPVSNETPEAFIERTMEYYKTKYDADIAAGKKRKLTWISSAQCTLSHIKSAAKSCKPAEWYNQLRLSDESRHALVKARNDRVEAISTDMPHVDAGIVIAKARVYLTMRAVDRASAARCLIGIAAVTGRRWGELLISVVLIAPTVTHTILPHYWANVSGISKQRGTAATYEIPIFARLNVINYALLWCRLLLPAQSLADANRRYANLIKRVMATAFPGISKAHDLRKVYVLICFKYFNESKSSLPKLACDCLCHKSMSAAILTYLGGYSGVDSTAIIFDDDDASSSSSLVPL